MKQIINRLAVILFAGTSILYSSCHDSEDNITPSGDYSPIRGDFPQGDSEWDMKIKEIKDSFGVYLLYKDITEQDLNRDWVSTGTGDLLVGGYEEDRDKGAWDLPDEHLPFYVNFFYNNIFPNITKEFANNTFPVKIYMINNLRGEPRNLGADSTQVNVGTETDPFRPYNFGNFDNWAISFKEDVIFGDDITYSLKQQRCVFILRLINNARTNGTLQAPEAFWDGFDFSGKMELTNTRKSNFRYKLGFIDRINDNFGTGRQKQVFVNEYITTCSYFGVREFDANNTYDLVSTYIKNAMWLTPEEFEERYPQSKYPLVHEKYNLIVDHIKATYGIDLTGIAYGPDNE